MSKIRLTDNDLITFFSVFDCCDKRQMVDEKSFNEYTEILCCACNEPIMFRCSSGLWYYAKGRVFA